MEVNDSPRRGEEENLPCSSVKSCSAQGQQTLTAESITIVDVHLQTEVYIFLKLVTKQFLALFHVQNILVTII